jgi:hypothetical protein
VSKSFMQYARTGNRRPPISMRLCCLPRARVQVVLQLKLGQPVRITPLHHPQACHQYKYDGQNRGDRTCMTVKKLASVYKKLGRTSEARMLEQRILPSSS